MPQPKHPMHRSSSIVPLGKVSIKGIQSALTHFYEDTALDPTQLGLTKVDYTAIDKEINGHTGSGQPCAVLNPATGSSVTISVWTTGVTSGNAALSGFGKER